MLQQGGNAIDAAVAMAATLNVAEPYMSGAAGVGYMVITTPGDSKPIVLNYIGRAPAAATPDKFPDEETKNFGIRSPLVPGSLAGWMMALERFGKLDRATVFAPAIEWAEHGFPLTIKNSQTIERMAERLRKWDTTSKTYLRDGEPLPPGGILQQKQLAETFKTIVREGADALYHGSIGAEIVRFSQEHDGLLTADDLASYKPFWQDPITVNYRGYQVYCPPLPCSGMQYLETLKLVEGFDMAGMGQNSPSYIHHLAEAMKLAVADRTTYAPNPDSPIDYLLSSDYLTQRRKLIDSAKAGFSGGDRFTSKKEPGEVLAGEIPADLRESTTHFVAADAEGFVVATTQTLGAPFGSGVVFGNTGLALNNFANWFDLDPASPNLIQPNKQVEMCLAPSQIWHDGKPYLMVGTPGSFGIMETTPQMMMNVLDNGFSIQAAIEAPRFKTGRGTEILIESRIPSETVEALTKLGHQVLLQDPYTMLVGGGQGVLIDPETGAFSGGADPRRDGYALAY